MSLLSNILIAKKGLDPVSMPVTPQVEDVTTIGIYPETPINCSGKWRIIVKSLFSANNVTCKARIVFHDVSQNIVGYSDELDIQNTNMSEDTKYHGTLFVVANELSASYFQVRITSAPTNSGNVSFYLGTT